MEQDSFRQRVLLTIAAIPYGKVASYGQIARLAGSARAARQVGAILKSLPSDSKLPWHRVVNCHGKISLLASAYQRQLQTLQAEGVELLQGKINLQQFGWNGEYTQNNSSSR
jgi:methylated-DNA-protein-cysteine methyltransferase-like protein